jgi:hypothetical protein
MYRPVLHKSKAVLQPTAWYLQLSELAKEAALDFIDKLAAHVARLGLLTAYIKT